MAAVSGCIFTRKYVYLILLTCLFTLGTSRIHKLELKNDERRYIALSTFGFYNRGSLDVHLKKFSFQPFQENRLFGFSLDKTVNDAISPYLENRQDKCILDEEMIRDDSMAVIFFTFDLKRKIVKINCSQNMQNIEIHSNKTILQSYPSLISSPRRERDLEDRREHKLHDLTSDTYLIRSRRRRSLKSDPGEEEEEVMPPTMSSVNYTKPQINVTVTKPEPVVLESTLSPKEEQLGTDTCGGIKLDIVEVKSDDPNAKAYSSRFVVMIQQQNEGLYNLYFHNCPNYQYNSMEQPTTINLSLQITEENDGNFLSAGEMPLPALYFTMAILFFLSACFWVFILKKSNSTDVFKTHYLMALLGYVKALSLMFHAINFHFIQTDGIHVESWAVLYYIAHLLKGALLFITIVLIGTGLAFVKHILSDKDKKIFMIVIPLQVLANVAEIIIEESEEGTAQHTTWKEVFILVDLLCCGAILFPVVWSIRHLQEASQTDGKAHINLRKLKLFRHFYIMIVCYIYFTRIIVYLLKITVPFQYEWLDEMFREMATYVFFVLTAYKFRPASNNPYFQLSQEEEEIEVDEIVTQSGATSGVTKLNRHKTGENEEEEKGSRRESSLEYDWS